jgi:hypothetical protein
MNRIFAVSMTAIWGVIAGIGMVQRHDGAWAPLVLMLCAGLVAVLND